MESGSRSRRTLGRAVPAGDACPGNRKRTLSLPPHR
jgi:hypothetical protein